MALFHDLPQELFIAILDALIHAARLRDHASILKRIMLVSKEWKEISQSTPSLWCTVSSGDSPEWVQRVLRNSGSDGPLNVRFFRYRGDDPRTKLFAKLVTPLTDRWVDLRIDWGPLTDVEDAARRGMGSPPTAHITPLFQGQMRHLRSLSLSEFRFLWDSQASDSKMLQNFFRSLSVPALGMANLFQILPSCPNITLLSIHDVNLKGRLAADGPPVILDHLSHINLRLSIEFAVTLLKRLQIPAASKRTVVVHSGGDDTEAWETLLDILAPSMILHLEQAEQNDSPQIALEYARGWTIKLASGSFTLGTSDPRGMHPPFVLSKLGHIVADVPFAVVYHQPPSANTLSELLPAIDATLRCVTFLRLPPNSQDLDQVFHAMVAQELFPTLRTLEIEQKESHMPGDSTLNLVGGITELLEARRGLEDTLMIRNRCSEAEVDDELRGLNKGFPEAFVFKEGGLKEWWDKADVHLAEDYEDPEDPLEVI